jgi:hypothetical protein
MTVKKKLVLMLKTCVRYFTVLLDEINIDEIQNKFGNPRRVRLSRPLVHSFGRRGCREINTNDLLVKNKATFCTGSGGVLNVIEGRR